MIQEIIVFIIVIIAIALSFFAFSKTLKKKSNCSISSCSGCAFNKDDKNELNCNH